MFDDLEFRLLDLEYDRLETPVGAELLPTGDWAYLATQNLKLLFCDLELTY